MPLPRPEPGLVIQYAYLWRDEALRGLQEGRKDRPCVIVVVRWDRPDACRVVVVPTTHAAPGDDGQAIPIPIAVKRRLGLDEEPTWIVATEANVFVWPGPDLRLAKRPDAERGIAYGYLPSGLFRRLVETFRARMTAPGAGLTSRSQ